MKKLNKNNVLKGAGVLLIAAVMILSTVAVTADTNEQTHTIPTCLITYGESNTIKEYNSDSENPSLSTVEKQNSHASFGGSRDVLWDNGDTDGSNGYSNADPGAFGYHRTLLDDFVIPYGQTWTITDFHSFQMWDTMAVGSGTDFLLSFWTDDGGIPGGLFATATTVSYYETATGREWFGRLEYRTDYTFDPIVLGPGRYWIEGNVIGPENNFLMIHESPFIGAECWVNYDDLGGLMPGFVQFGVSAGLAFTLTGEIEIDPDIIWDNGMNYEGLLAAQYDDYDDFDAYPADDFVFEDDKLVNDVHWIGGYWNGGDGNFDWQVIFYSDRGDGGAPGDVIDTYFFPNAAVGEVFIEGDYYYYEVDLPDPILFSGGEKYWITIHGIGNRYPQSGWGYHSDPILLHMSVFMSEYFGFYDWTNSEDVLGFPFDMCFQLTGGDPPTIPDLDCIGDLSWADVQPGSTVTGEFFVLNVGDPGSQLDWEITEWPDWGDWTFVPASGDDLTPEDGSQSIEVFVEAPNEQEQHFSGHIKVANTEDPADYCIIDVSLATPQNQHSSLFFRILERFPHAFPLLRNLLGQ